MTEASQAIAFQKKEALSKIILEAEILFLDKVNEYRKSKKAEVLKTRSEAQLMALNHCIWMRHHNKLTHSQKKGTSFFSGSSLLKRLEFVDEKSRIEIVSENVAELDLTEEDYEDKANLAEYLADNFFDTWKSSPPHRENMLDKEIKFHGISIVQKGNRFYATHVFLG
jgi:uncharacterized protein YkwD